MNAVPFVISQVQPAAKSSNSNKKIEGFSNKILNRNVEYRVKIINPKQVFTYFNSKSEKESREKYEEAVKKYPSNEGYRVEFTSYEKRGKWPDICVIDFSPARPSR